MGVWKAIVNNATGDLESVCSVVGDIKAGRTIIDLGDTRPDQGTIWNPSTRTFAARPAVVLIDRVLDDLANDPALVAIWQSLTPAQRTTLRNRLGNLLGPRRFRVPSEPVDLETP